MLKNCVQKPPTVGNIPTRVIDPRQLNVSGLVNPSNVAWKLNDVRIDVVDWELQPTVRNTDGTIIINDIEMSDDSVARGFVVLSIKYKSEDTSKLLYSDMMHKNFYKTYKLEYSDGVIDNVVFQNMKLEFRSQTKLEEPKDGKPYIRIIARFIDVT